MRLSFDCFSRISKFSMYASFFTINRDDFMLIDIASLRHVNYLVILRTFSIFTDPIFNQVCTNGNLLSLFGNFSILLIL